MRRLMSWWRWLQLPKDRRMPLRRLWAPEVPRGVKLDPAPDRRGEAEERLIVDCLPGCPESGATVRGPDAHDGGLNPILRAHLGARRQGLDEHVEDETTNQEGSGEPLRWQCRLIRDVEWPD